MIRIRHMGIGMLLTVLSAGSIHGAEDGILNVKTTPEGIEVWLDDKYIGDSPIIEKKLKPGRYSLKLIDPIQHSSTSEEIFIQPGEITIVEKTIVGKYGSVKIATDPEGAEVTISTKLGKTPLSNDFMNPGKYRLKIKHPSKFYEPVVEDITVPRGKPVNISRELERKNPFDMKALVRLGLGAGAAVGFVWAIVEQGNYRENLTKADMPTNAAERDALEAKANTAATKRTVGIVVGALCIVGFEIVAFF